MILLDTGPLVAICDATDSLHARAVRDLGRLARRRLVTGSPILTEACALLPAAVQRRRLARFLTEFAVESYPADAEPLVWREVFEWLDRYQEHDPDWCDGYLAVVAAREPRAAVWTYDREFSAIWRRPDGRSIPLAVK